MFSYFVFHRDAAERPAGCSLSGAAGVSLAQINIDAFKSDQDRASYKTTFSPGGFYRASLYRKFFLRCSGLLVEKRNSLKI